VLILIFAGLMTLMGALVEQTARSRELEANARQLAFMADVARTVPEARATIVQLLTRRIVDADGIWI
jgi:hypothetical protein